MSRALGIPTLLLLFFSFPVGRAPGQKAKGQEDTATSDLQKEVARLREELAQYAEEMKRLEESIRLAGQRPDEVAAAGRRIYRASCMACHGARGDGKGPGAGPLSPQPRDFGRGTFKWRSTPTGSLPLDSDLYRTVSEGVPGTSMPSWKKLLSPEERWAAIQYVKLFSNRFVTEKPDEPLPITREPPSTPESIARGRAIYASSKCSECHGDSGKGDGPASPTLRDDTGAPSKAFDFTRGEFRCGSKNADIYKTFSTGLDGTPMPGYADVILEKERWALVHYVRSLTRERSFLDYFLRRPTDPW